MTTQISEQFMQAFRDRLADEIRGYLETAEQEVDVKAMTHVYLCQVLAHGLDEDFKRMVHEHGDPARWEGGWFREFIDEFTDMYKVFTQG